MSFVANLPKLMERGVLEIDGGSTSHSTSIDIPIGDIYWVDGYRLDYGKDSWLKENGRILLAEAEYIAFTKDRISIPPNYEFYIDPRSSFARLGLQATVFENDPLSKIIDPNKLPQFNGRVPLVIRMMRTCLYLPEDFPALQILVAEKGTQPLSTVELIEACKSHYVEVLRDGQEVNLENGEFALTFHPEIKRYRQSGVVLNPSDETERYFQTFLLSQLFREESDVHFRIHSSSLDETCFYLGSTTETVRIGNRHLGMLTQHYPTKWTRVVYRNQNDQQSLGYEAGFGWGRRENIEQFVEPSGYVHLTPWIKPGSNGTQTLEIAAKTFSHNRVLVKTGDYACSLQIFPLDEESEPYDGRYRNQNGPLTSLLYKAN